MEAKSLRESDGNSNPIPCSSVILRIRIPEAHQNHRLNQNKFIGAMA